MVDFLGIIGFFLILLVCFLVGKSVEKKHYQKLEKREARLRHILVFNEKIPPHRVAGQPFFLVSGSVVMSGDYFKQVVASLKNFFGGRLTSFEAMMDLGRREAIVRMKEDAARRGASMIFNVRLETATLNQAQGKQGLACAEHMAYGTAWVVPKQE